MPGNDDILNPDLNSDQGNGEQVPAIQPKIESYSVKLPSFWSELAEGWFIQVEAQFRTSRITQERTKFDYTVQALSSDAVKSVYNTILQCQTDPTPFTTLKNALINRYTLTETQRLERLLEGTEMGDMRPSEYYNSLKVLAGSSSSVNEKLLLSIWLRRLPPLVQAVVKGKENNLSTEALIASADSVFEVCDNKILNVSQITSTSRPTIENQFDELKNQLINVIDKKFSQLNTRRNRSQSRGRNQQQSNGSQNSGNKQSDLCYYHMKFGDKAKKCRDPCSKSKN